MDVRKKTLVRNKAIAGGLMVGAALLFVIARSQKGSGIWEWVAAFSEAAMVGALADWFAVVALFRHPLGVPIPHTAIVPNKKEAIAESLAEFIRDKFLATEALLAKIRELNPARRLSVYLMTPQHADGLAEGLTRVLFESIDFIDDDRVRKILMIVSGKYCAQRFTTGLISLTLQPLPGSCWKRSERTIAIKPFLMTF